MKNHFQKHKHHYVRASLGVIFCAVMYIVAVVGFSSFHNVAVSQAASTDSSVRILITGGYQGSASATTTGHSIGNCTNRVGNLFTISTGTYTTCSGTSMGSPDGMRLYIPTAPSGFRVTTWRLSYNSTNGSVSCSTTGCTINFSSGSAAVEVQIDPISPPTPPTVKVVSVTSNGLIYSWSAGNAGSGSFIDYLPYFNGNSMGVQTAQGMSVQSLDCGRSYSFYVAMRTTAGNYNSNTVTATTTPCSSPPPPSSPPSAPPSGSGSTTSSPSSSAVNRATTKSIQGPSSSTIPTDQATTDPVTNAELPLETPARFKAYASKGSSRIELSWGEVSGIGDISYVLERSTDGQAWDVLDDNITDNYYTDTATKFATHYFYRLTASDSNGPQSSSTTTEVTSGSFLANADNDKDLVLVTKDGYARVTIPAGSLADPSNCSFAAQPRVPLTGSEKLQTVGGPYQLVCQNQAGASNKPLLKPALVQVLLPDSVQEKYKNYQYQSYETDGGWQTVSVKEGSASFELTGRQTAFVVQGQEKHFPKWIIVLIVLIMLIAGSIFGLRILSQTMRRRRLQALEQDYWHKMNGV